MTTTQDPSTHSAPITCAVDSGSSDSMIGTPAGALVLRVEGAGYDGQEFQVGLEILGSG